MQQSTLECISDVAIVLEAEEFPMRRRSRIEEKQALEAAEMCLDMERVESKITPRLRAVSVRVTDKLEGIERQGLDSSESCRGRSMTRNSVLE